MPRVKIKQLEERVATAGMHLGGGAERRKLEPGEVIDIPEDMMLPDGTTLFDTIWETGKLELTMDPATRPIDYENYREGVLCSPRFKPRDASEELEMKKVRDKVMSRLPQYREDLPAGLDEEPARKPKPREALKKRTRVVNKRLQRRVARKATQHGAEITA